jgi:DNA mismatch repair protein MutL
MTPKIRLLPDVLINKIAAGEVIERPASVVKELVENALDAGATSVTVNISEGGLALIEVTDNGCGMTPEDLKLAVCRHATSKIEKPEDLFNIHSFGFRGEALPSITSVSQCLIKSRTHGAASGYLLEISGGVLSEESETGCDYGTFISVRNLFFNTPARRKFLRSPSSEVRRVVEVVESLAISNPLTEFVVDSDNQRLLDLSSAADRIERARQLFGASLADKFVRGERSGDGLHLEVYLSKPEICRRNRSRVMILVNNRRIESKALFASMTSAYGEFLTHGTYPQGAVFITIEPSLVDVNVHPAKSEVRFADERIIFHTLYHLVREALLGGSAVPGAFGVNQSRISGGQTQLDRQAGTRQSMRDFFGQSTSGAVQSEESLAAIFGKPTTGITDQMDSHFENTVPPGTCAAKEEMGLPSAAVVIRKALGISGEVRFQQLALMYIVALTADSVFIIDQHAAHERILYETAMKSLASRTITSQQLLFPVPIHLEPDDFYTYNQEQETFAALGFSLESFGPRQLQLTAAPAILAGKNPEILFRELLDDFSGISGDSQKRFQKKAASFACRGALMAGDRMDEPGMRALFTGLLAAENPYVCPHGRPTMIRLSKDELDVRFGRI